MTINKLINLLKIDGKGTKLEVLRMLENAKLEDLLELRQSINERIREIKRYDN